MTAPLRRWLARRLLPVCTLLVACACASAAADGAWHLRVVGGTGRYAQHEARFWTEELPRLSQGRFRASLMPFDRAGVPGQKMLDLISVGVVPLGTVTLAHVAGEWPELAIPDMAGLSGDLASLRRMVQAFRPATERLLRERFNARLLAVYVYPAQVFFCRQPMQALAEIKGRRVRVSGYSQADFVRALGAEPVFTEFNAMMGMMESDGIDCAITGAMAGNAVGLHRVTGTLFTQPLNWGLTLFAVNEDAWAAFPPELQALLLEHMPRLEARNWAESDSDALAGVACNIGASTCEPARRGRMQAQAPGVADERLRRDILANAVLPGWMRRCGSACAELWNQTLAPLVGLRAGGRP